MALTSELANALADSIERADNPVRLMRDAGFEPDPWQKDALANWRRDTLLLCSRQSGKSLTAAALADSIVHHQDEALVVLTAPSERQSNELLRTCAMLYDRLPYAHSRTARRDTESRLELPNGSRILAVPGSGRTIRGLPKVSAIIVDEGAQVEDAFLADILPMLATTGGPMWALTTPYGKRGWFWKEWTREATYYQKFKVTADQCPRITQAYLDKERERLPHWQFMQEFFCNFAETDESVFTTALIEKMFNNDLRAIHVAPTA